MKYLLIITTILFLKINVSAQQTGENKLGTWYVYFGNHKVSDKLSINTGAQLWTYEPISNFNFRILHTGLNYHFNNKMTASFVYGNVNWDRRFEDTDEPNTKENRIYEQFSLKSKVGKFSLENRLRYEQRFLVVGETKETLKRIRYRIKATLPLTKTFFINVYDEIIFNVNDPIFQQNRLYGALGIKASKNYSIQLGYLKNNFKTKAYDRLQVGLYVKTDFRKKTKGTK